MFLYRATRRGLPPGGGLGAPDARERRSSAGKRRLADCSDARARDRPPARRGPGGLRRGDARPRGRAGQVAAGRDGVPRAGGRLRRGADVRRRDARRPGGGASLAGPREGAAGRPARARGAAARRLPRRAAAGGGGRRRGAPGARAGDRLARRGVDARGGDRPRAFGALPPASRPSSGTATSSRCRPARRRSPRSPVCLQALPDRRVGLGHPVPRRGHRARTPRRGSTTTAATRTPFASGSIPRRSRRQTRARDRRPGT